MDSRIDKKMMDGIMGYVRTQKRNFTRTNYYSRKEERRKNIKYPNQSRVKKRVYPNYISLQKTCSIQLIQAF